MTTSLSPDLNWVGQRVHIGPTGGLYLVRCISLNGQRAFLSLVADPQFLTTADVGELTIPPEPEPEPEAEGDEYASPLEN